MISEHILYNLNSLQFIETHFMSQNMVHPSNVAHALEKNIYSAAVGWNVLATSIRLIWLTVSTLLNLY